MRVLIATENRGIVGGLELYLHSIIPQLIAAGLEVALLTETGTPAPADGIHSRCPGIVMWDAGGRRTSEIVKELSEWKPDVLYYHGLVDPQLEYALITRFPTVFFPHRHHGMCVSGTKCHASPEYEACRRTLGLGCLARYHLRRCGGLNPLTMLGLYRNQRQKHANLNHYRKLVVASRYMVGEYLRHGVPEDRIQLITHIPPGVTRDRAPPLPRQRSDRVLFVGRITPTKGLSHLIAALPVASANLGRRLSLVVAGAGSDRAAAEADAQRAGVKAEFLGWLGPEARTAVMRTADILAFPSLAPETFGLVGIEAGCVGVPTVGYATGGITEWLIPGVSGESAPGDRPNPTELAAAIVRALADDSHLQQLRVGAWETAGRFTIEAHLAQLIPILEQAACS